MSTGLQALAEQVLAGYPIRHRAIRLIQQSEMKAIWKIAAGDKIYGLKRLRYPKDKILFAIQAQKHLQDNGGPVPHLVRTKQGELFTERNGQVFILYRWVEGRAPSFADPADLKKAVGLLASFHKASPGFKPAIACRESTKLGKWPLQYETMTAHFRSWQNNAPFPRLAAALKPHWSEMIRLGESARSRLERSGYNTMVKQEPPTLCHQDYSEGNVLLNARGGCVIDLDSVTYDFPARDLRKLILKRMVEKRRWDQSLFNSIMTWYKAVNPLTRDQLQLVYADLSYPHLFHETAKNPYRKGSSVSEAKLLTAVRIEKEKAAALFGKSRGAHR